MNSNPRASVTELARNIKVPRSTAYRLLDTLVGLGFVSMSATGGYSLSRQVRTLSEGFIDEAWLGPAWEELLRLGEQLVWPVSLFTCEAAVMVIRRTTHELSTMSIDYGMSGRRLPITQTAAGRCYLAFCPEAERRLILDMPAAYIGGQGTHLEQIAIEEKLQEVRARGFDTRVGGLVPKTGSIAVPVIVDNKVLCCASVIYIASALSLRRAVAEFELPMKAFAARLAARLAKET